MAFLQCTSMRGEVQTIDEGAHLAAGMSYWQTRDFRLNEEHPPLIKLLAGAAALTARPTLPFDNASWKEGNQWAFAQDLLYHSGNNADDLLFRGRVPMVALSLLLGWVIYLWARRFGGDIAGLLALGWYIFDPNFLAHGRYITTDVPVALGFAATLYLLTRYISKATWKYGVAFGAVFALTQATKFSAIILWPIIFFTPLLWMLWSPGTRGQWRLAWQRTYRTLGWAIAGMVVIIPLVYLGQFQKGSQDSWITWAMEERDRVVSSEAMTTQPPAVQRLITLSDPSTSTGKVVRNILLNTPIPAWSYGKGLALVINHDFWGHLSYLNGMYGNKGWVQYFPITFLVKTPFATLIVFALAIVAGLVAARKKLLQLPPAFWVLSGSAILYFAWSLTSHINLGQRHIFPVYPAVFVTIGLFLAAVVQQHRRWLTWLFASITGLYLLTSLLTYPAYTSYFSEVIGGTANGPRYLVDSNIDWGQDVKRLQTYMEEKQIPFVCMSYFGQANLVYYGLDFRYLPTKADRHDPAAVNCAVAISVTSLLAQDGDYWWLRQYEPDARIGGSLYVYDFRNGRSPQLAANPL